MAKYKRTAHRWNLILSVTGAVAFASASFWLMQLMSAGVDSIQPDPNKNEPDYIVEQFSVVRMSASGQPRYIISGDKLSHRPVGDWSEVVQPLVQNLEPGRAPLTIRANSARILHVEDEVRLIGQVRIERAAALGAAGMHLATEGMTIYPDRDLMQTALPVQMKVGAASVQGTGLKIDNAARTLHSPSRGTIVYPPKHAR